MALKKKHHFRYNFCQAIFWSLPESGSQLCYQCILACAETPSNSASSKRPTPADCPRQKAEWQTDKKKHCNKYKLFKLLLFYIIYFQLDVCWLTRPLNEMDVVRGEFAHGVPSQHATQHLKHSVI